MTNKNTNALTAATLPLAGTETVPMWDGATKKVAVDDLTVKNLRSNATSGIMQIAGPAAASTRVATVPNANWTAARTDAAQSFTGDQTLATGNLVQGTAAKGVNFTANTPAAGMTSQLLNWYEEGTWTPTFATWAVAPTLDIATYVRIGRQVTLNMVAHGGTCSLGNSIAGIPFTSSSTAGASVLSTTDGNALGFTGAIFNSSSTISNLSAAVLGASRYWVLSTTYFV